MKEFIKIEPKAKQFIKPLISAREFLNGEKRWCLWLVDAKPNELKEMPEVMKRIKLVKEFREKSIAPSTRKFAEIPSLFRDRNQPNTYILIPRVSSENRKYIPIGFFDKNSIVSDSCMSIPEANLFHFGVLTSYMHIAWMKYVCGRLESRFRYSKDIVYNNFPWPEKPTSKQIANVEKLAQKVLDVREEFIATQTAKTVAQTLAKALSVDTKEKSVKASVKAKEKSKERIKLEDTGRNAYATTNTVDQDACPTLSDLYDLLSMPPKLLKAHADLDKAVDACYRSQPFTSESKRMEFLFELYDKYVNQTEGSELVGKKKGKKKSKKFS